ncbi:MAG TPA: hypothetical protein VFK13_07095 [Gemmatimonadaceae bacterium]|nr:hypothetical protein [Gemmatimonadaceae bacterium]
MTYQQMKTLRGDAHREFQAAWTALMIRMATAAGEWPPPERAHGRERRGKAA